MSSSVNEEQCLSQILDVFATLLGHEKTGLNVCDFMCVSLCQFSNLRPDQFDSCSKNDCISFTVYAQRNVLAGDRLTPLKTEAQQINIGGDGLYRRI